MSYEHLMGTADEGSYLGPSRVLINKRRLRQGPKGTLEYISQVQGLVPLCISPGILSRVQEH